MTDLIIIGAGNPDIIRLIEDINDVKKTFNLIGFLDNDKNLIGKSVLGYEILGNDEMLLNNFNDISVVNNVMASTLLHQKVTENLKERYRITKFPNIIHPSVNMKYVSLGEGNVIYNNVLFGVNVVIGNFNFFFPGSVVGHEAKMGNYCLMAGSTTASSRTTIGDRVTFASRSMVIHKKSICSDVFIGAGSVVIRSIKTPKKVFGNPAYEIE